MKKKFNFQKISKINTKTIHTQLATSSLGSSNKTTAKLVHYSPISGQTNTSSIHSSGIHSCEYNDQADLDEDEELDESIENVPIRKDGFLSVNTIKYNAKTNVVQQQKFSAQALASARKNVVVGSGVSESLEDEEGEKLQRGGGGLFDK